MTAMTCKKLHPAAVIELNCKRRQFKNFSSSVAVTSFSARLSGHLLQTGNNLFTGLVGSINAIIETDAVERIAGQDQSGM